MNATATAKMEAVRFGVTGTSATVQTLQRKTAIVVATSAAMAAVLFVLWTARAVLLLLFAGVILAILLRAASRWIERKTKFSAGWALALLLFGTALLITLGIWFRGSEVSSQVDQLQQKLPTAAKQLVAILPNFTWGVGSFAMAQIRNKFRV